MESLNGINASRKVLSTLGARNIAREEREKEDYYATGAKAVDGLMKVEKFSPVVLEPMCGEGHISRVLERYGYRVVSSDNVNRGYGIIKDLFDYTSWKGDIVSNPPYKSALECIRHCLEIVEEGSKVAMLLRLQFLEGKERGRFYEDNPPKVLYVARGRLHCAKNGDFERYKGHNAIAYAWFVWEKGYRGCPQIKWFN